MPELPEVETVVNALRPHTVGRLIASVTTSGFKLRHPVDLERRTEISGRVIADIRRRAKYIIIDLGDNNGLLFHLGMSGSFRVEPAERKCRKHDHVILNLDDGNSIRFNDPRRFGIAKYVAINQETNEPDELTALGPEPLSDDFSAAYLVAACKGRNKPIKNLIMDNHVVVGVGNIYASESLFRSGIRPTKPSSTLSKTRLSRLQQAIRDVLHDAIKAGGSTIHTFERVDGTEGGFQRHLDVYGLAGETCGSCKRGTIRSLTLAGRSTYYCPVCQK